jgi:mannitol operon repressor
MNQEEIAEDFSRFLEDLQRETDRGLPLVAAAIVEEKLLLALKAYFRECKAAESLLTGYSAPLGTFSAKIDACHALGLIDDFEFAEITLIRKVRNEFAHTHSSVTFDDEPVRGFCATLTSPVPSGYDKRGISPRFKFVLAIVNVLQRIYWRHTHIAPERVEPRRWGNPEHGWQDVANPPKSGGIYLVIVQRGYGREPQVMCARHHGSPGAVAAEQGTSDGPTSSSNE